MAVQAYGKRARPTLAWADAIGASRAVNVLAHLQAHYGEPRYRRSPRLSSAHHTKETFHG